MAVNYKDFNATIYAGDVKVGWKGKITLKAQHSLERFKIKVLSKYPKWVRVNYYDRKTNECESIVNPQREHNL
jgi:hypothetical protein